MDAIAISLFLGAPWILAIIWTWSRGLRYDGVPPSMGERARARLFE